MPNQTVLVDIDDTLAATQDALLAFANQRSPVPFKFEDLTEEHREGHPEYEKYVQEFLADPQHIAGSQPYAFALDGLKRLHQAGYQIHIVSSRREPLHDVTTAWLQEHGFVDYVERVHPRSSEHPGPVFKSLVAEQIKPAAAFDDTLEVARALAGSGTPVYLIDKPWNTAADLPDNIIRAADFGEAVTDFLSRSAPAPTPPN